MKYRKLRFPSDEACHNTVGEWWYFNGNLQDDKGNRYSYMNTLFRAMPPVKNTTLKKITDKNIYFYHSIITDIENDKFYPHKDNLVILGKNSFQRQGANIYFSPAIAISRKDNYYIEQIDRSRYRLAGKNLYLDLVSTKIPLLENKRGYVNFFNRPTFYYSLTSLDTEGSIFVEGKEIKVSGKSWMDHRWSDVFDITKDFWNWFSIQLSNKIEVVCCQYGHKKRSVSFATIIYPSGKQETFYDLEFTPTGDEWQSPLTKAVYNLSWQIKINGLNARFDIASEVTKHEMVFLNINYWESPTVIHGKIGTDTVEGFGYMELAGCPSILNSRKFLRETIISQITKKTIARER